MGVDMVAVLVGMRVGAIRIANVVFMERRQVDCGVEVELGVEWELGGSMGLDGR